jgi:eukaryotic-like serine/threonine-protein kinase
MIPIEEGSVFAGRYRLERALARGGMGSVWVAQHTQLDVHLAIKFMDPTFAASSDARSRFEREAKAAAKLQSPHVVQVHDYGVEDNTPFIVMELLVGEDLGDRLKRERRLSLKATSDIVTQTAKALRRAHEEKIVHRDLKPGNIFLAKNQDDEIVKVLDFGIAKARMSTDGEVTKTGTLIGSPHYMSPEQARSGKNLDHRSDLWSLAVIVFRALTGHLPFPGDEIGEVIMAICADPIPVPSHVAPDLGPDVDQFFVRALARDPAKRFQSAKEMAEAFAVLAGAGAAAAGASIVLAAPAIADDPSASDLETRVDDSTAVAPTPQPTSSPAGTSDAGTTPAPVEDAKEATPGPRAAESPRYSEPPSPTGSLAPAGSTVAGLPKNGSRTAVIAVAVVAGIVALGGAGLVMSRGSGATPPAPPLPTAPTARVETPPPPVPTVTATAPAEPTVAATAPPVESATALPHGSAAPVKGPLKKKKETDPKPPSGNPLLGF